MLTPRVSIAIEGLLANAGSQSAELEGELSAAPAAPKLSMTARFVQVIS